MDYQIRRVGDQVTQSGTTNTDNQYRLPLTDEVKSFSDLAITDANRSAISTIRKLQAWQSLAMCLIGPPRCGLGVIGKLWAKEADARLVSASALDKMSLQDASELATKNLVLDLADAIDSDERFLTVLNLSRANGVHVLLTARSAPALWTCQSADLKSRIDAIPVAEIYPPHEDMLRL